MDDSRPEAPELELTAVPDAGVDGADALQLGAPDAAPVETRPDAAASADADGPFAMHLAAAKQTDTAGVPAKASKIQVNGADHSLAAALMGLPVARGGKATKSAKKSKPKPAEPTHAEPTPLPASSPTGAWPNSAIVEPSPVDPSSFDTLAAQSLTPFNGAFFADDAMIHEPITVLSGAVMGATPVIPTIALPAIESAAIDVVAAKAAEIAIAPVEMVAAEIAPAEVVEVVEELPIESPIIVPSVRPWVPVAPAQRTPLDRAAVSEAVDTSTSKDRAAASSRRAIPVAPVWPSEAPAAGVPARAAVPVRVAVPIVTKPQPVVTTAVRPATAVRASAKTVKIPAAAAPAASVSPVRPFAPGVPRPTAAELEAIADAVPTSTGAWWTIPLTFVGIAIVACAVLIPAADENRRDGYELAKIERDVDYFQRQSAVNQDFLKRVNTDPTLAERLAMRQLHRTRPGAKAAPLTTLQSDRFGASPYAMTRLDPPVSMPAYTPIPGKLSEWFLGDKRPQQMAGLGLCVAGAGVLLGGLRRRRPETSAA